MGAITKIPKATGLKSNITSICPVGTTADENGNCVQDNMLEDTSKVFDLKVWNDNRPLNISSNGSSSCQEQGKVECTNGSCADTVEECESIYEDYNKDIGYDPEGKFITDDPETSYDDALYDVYLAIGGR